MQGHPSRVCGVSSRGPLAQDAIYLLPRTSMYHPGCCKFSSFNTTSDAGACVRLIWDQNTSEVQIPLNNPLVAISHLFGKAIDVDGSVCGHFEMKIIKRLARNADTGALLRPLQPIGKYMLVELRERATSNTAAGYTTANLVSGMFEDIAEASRMIYSTNDHDAGVAPLSFATKTSSYKNAALLRLQKRATHQRNLNNLIGGSTSISPFFSD